METRVGDEGSFEGLSEMYEVCGREQAFGEEGWRWGSLGLG